MSVAIKEPILPSYFGRLSFHCNEKLAESIHVPIPVLGCEKVEKYLKNNITMAIGVNNMDPRLLKLAAPYIYI